jgi:hypothetical protein
MSESCLIGGGVPMSRSIWVAAIVVIVAAGDASAAGWPSWLSFANQRPQCARCAGPSVGMPDDSPLMPEVHNCTFGRSNCKLSFCETLYRSCFHKKSTEVQIYPPLPYGARPVSHVSPPPAPAPSAETPAPVPAPSPETPAPATNMPPN